MMQKVAVVALVWVLAVASTVGATKVTTSPAGLESVVQQALSSGARDVKPFLRAWDRATAENKREAEKTLNEDIEEHKSLGMMLGDIQRLGSAPSLEEKTNGARVIHSNEIKVSEHNIPAVPKEKMKNLEKSATLKEEEALHYAVGAIHGYITEKRIKATVVAAEGLLMYADQKKIEFSIYKSSPENEPIQMKGPRLFYQEIFSQAAVFQHFLGTLGTYMKGLLVKKDEKPKVLLDSLRTVTSRMANVVSVHASEQTARLNALQNKYLHLTSDDEKTSCRDLDSYANSPTFWSELDMTAKMSGYTGITMTNCLMTVVEYLKCTHTEWTTNHKKCAKLLEKNGHDTWAEFHLYNDQESGISDLEQKFENYRNGNQQPNYDAVLNELLENNDILKKHFPNLSIVSGDATVKAFGIDKGLKGSNSDEGEGGSGKGGNGGSGDDDSDPASQSDWKSIVAKHKKDLDALNEKRKKDVDDVVKKYEEEMNGLHETAVEQLSAKVEKTDDKAKAKSLLDEIQKKMQVSVVHPGKADTTDLEDFLKDRVKDAEDTEANDNKNDEGNDDGDDGDDTSVNLGDPVDVTVRTTPTPDVDIEETREKIQKALKNLASSEEALLQQSLQQLNLMLEAEDMGKNANKMWGGSIPDECEGIAPKPALKNNGDIVNHLMSSMEEIRKLASATLSRVKTTETQLREGYTDVIEALRDTAKQETATAKVAAAMKIREDTMVELKGNLQKFSQLRKGLMEYFKDLMEEAHKIFADDSGADGNYVAYMCRMNIVSTTLRLRNKLVEPASNLVDTYMQFAVTYFNEPFKSWTDGAARVYYDADLESDGDSALRALEEKVKEATGGDAAGKATGGDAAGKAATGGDAAGTAGKTAEATAAAGGGGI